jgi:tetratricopeptide (TPR) repeat protein
MMSRATIAVLLSASLLGVGCTSNRKAPLPELPDPAKGRQVAIALFGKAKEAEKREDWSAAEKLYRQGLSNDDDISGAWNNFGVVLLRQQKYLEAVPAFQRAADLSPRDPTPYENLGLVYHQAGYAEEALKSYEMSLARDPNWLPSLRGATVCVKLLNRSDQDSLDRVRRGLLIEQDAKWRGIFNAQRSRIENDLREEALRM